MEKIKTYKIDLNRKKPIQYTPPINWLREYLEDGDELELYQEGDRLILTPKKKEKIEPVLK